MPKTSINISDTSLSWENLDQSVKKAYAALSSAQQQKGYWVYELEADATIPAEYILLEHFIDQINDPLEQKMAVYLRRIQSDIHGGWPLYHNGDFDLSASVKAYFALKAVGDDISAGHAKPFLNMVAQSAQTFLHVFSLLYLVMYLGAQHPLCRLN